MKKTIAIIAASLSISACSDAELVQISKGQCDQIGYAPDSLEYKQCVERGFRGSKEAQDNAIAGSILTAIILGTY